MKYCLLNPLYLPFSRAADKVIYYDGQVSIECTAHAPESLLTGMNKFLKQLDITFRRDPTNWRPRINKFESVKDTEQKIAGQYFFFQEDPTE